MTDIKTSERLDKLERIVNGISELSGYRGRNYKPYGKYEDLREYEPNTALEDYFEASQAIQGDEYKPDTSEDEGAYKAQLIADEIVTETNPDTRDWYIAREFIKLKSVYPYELVTNLIACSEAQEIFANAPPANDEPICDICNGSWQGVNEQDGLFKCYHCSENSKHLFAVDLMKKDLDRIASQNKVLKERLEHILRMSQFNGVHYHELRHLFDSEGKALDPKVNEPNFQQDVFDALDEIEIKDKEVKE